MIKRKNNFYKKILLMVKDRKLDDKELLKICQFNDKSYSSVKTRLGQMLRDEGDGKTLKDFLKGSGRKMIVTILIIIIHPPIRCRCQ